MMVDRVGVGVIGCGVISGAYLKAVRHFPILSVRAVADLNREAAAATAAEFGTEAVSVEDLLADPAIEIVINLTIPKAHKAVSLQVLRAGKHVHSEKPLGITFAEGREVMEVAEAAGLRVGCAPDTFLGGAHQACRKLLDDGAIGTPIGGTAFFLNPGHERWHPAPAFYYQVGGGPVLDMGPYYITDLVNLLGPVEEVSAMVATPRSERIVTSEPLKGARIPVEVPTHAAATLRFVSGPVVQVAFSFDVQAHGHVPLEIYGTGGSMVVPDPNWFGGEVRILTPGEDWSVVDHGRAYADDNYRVIGVAARAHAIREERPHRASGGLALHVLEVMEAFALSSDTGRSVAMQTRPHRPALLEGSL
jgi:predicted dehydrogenase